MAFLEREFERDPTNSWVPNHACVEAMIRSSGLEVIERPGHETYLCRPGPDGFRHGRTLASALGVELPD